MRAINSQGNWYSVDSWAEGRRDRGKDKRQTARTDNEANLFRESATDRPRCVEHDRAPNHEERKSKRGARQRECSLIETPEASTRNQNGSSIASLPSSLSVCLFLSCTSTETAPGSQLATIPRDLSSRSTKRAQKFVQRRRVVYFCRLR